MQKSIQQQKTLDPDNGFAASPQLFLGTEAPLVSVWSIPLLGYKYTCVTFRQQLASRDRKLLRSSNLLDHHGKEFCLRQRAHFAPPSCCLFLCSFVRMHLFPTGILFLTPLHRSTRAALLFWCLISSCLGVSIRHSMSNWWEYTDLGMRQSSRLGPRRRFRAEDELWEMEYRGRGG